jgi:hypothetical protein
MMRLDCETPRAAVAVCAGLEDCGCGAGRIKTNPNGRDTQLPVTFSTSTYDTRDYSTEETTWVTTQYT